MKIKRYVLAICGLILFLLLTACSNVSTPKVDNWSKYQQKKSITIGFDNTFVPMGFEQKMVNMLVLILIWQMLSLKNMG